MEKRTDLQRYFDNIGIRPTFSNNKIFGNLYVLENFYKTAKFPEKFIGLSDKTNKFYLVDCICYDEKEFVEYRFIELDYGDLYRMSIRETSEYELYRKHMDGIYTYLEDFEGIVYENNDYFILAEDDELPPKDSYLRITWKTFKEATLLGLLLDDSHKLIELKDKKEEED